MTATAKRTPLADGMDMYVPVFEIAIEGTKLSLAVTSAISEVVYRDSLDEVASLELTIADWDAEHQRFTYSEDDTFLPGQRMRAAFGYRGQDKPVPLFDGRVTALQPDFPREGHPRLVVRALDLLHELRKEQRSAVYEDMTDAEIAQQIAGDLDADIETSTGGADEPRQPFLFQRNQYDVMFLRERARARGYELTVSLPEGARRPLLYFGPSQANGQPEYQLTYGRSLTTFQASLSAARQVSQVVVRSWDPLGKELLEATADRARVKSLGDPSGFERSFSGRREIVVDTPVDDQAEAESVAAAVRDDIARGALVATAETRGLPFLRAGRRVVLDGLGDRFSGTYLVTASHHRIGARGYETRFDCRKEDKA